MWVFVVLFLLLVGFIAVHLFVPLLKLAALLLVGAVVVLIILGIVKLSD